MEIFNRVPQSVHSQLTVIASTEAQKKQYLINMFMWSYLRVRNFLLILIGNGKVQQTSSICTLAVSSSIIIKIMNTRGASKFKFFNQLCYLQFILFFQIFSSVNLKNFSSSCLFIRKYPEFMSYVSQFLQHAERAVCKDPLDQADFILTNPCGHLLCVECSCQFSRLWQDGAEPELRCPVCRTTLLEHKFTKAYSIRSSKMSATSLFTWVPTSMYMNTSYDQLLIEALIDISRWPLGAPFF